MARASDFTYPAFFSYSHADSAAYGKYVDRFHKTFGDILEGKLEQRQLQLGPPFLDSLDMPSVGDLDKLLDTRVKNSFALFLFVGQGYINSQYCIDELKYFSRLFTGAQDELRDRVWILELEPLKGDILERFKSRLREANAERLWTNVRAQLYDPRTGELMSLKDNEGDPTGWATDRFGKFAEDLANRIQKAASTPTARHTEFKRDVVIGAVTKDLVKIANELKAHLQAAGLAVDSLFENEVFELEPEELKDCFAHSRFVVLPVSDAKVLIPVYQGGHVKLQLDALSALPGTRHVLWTPPDVPSLAAEQREQHTKHREMWGSAWDERQKQNVADMAADIRRKLHGVFAGNEPQAEAIRVLIETSSGEDSSWESIGESLEVWWQKHFPDAAKKYRLEFEALSLTRLFEKQLDLLGDGVVVLRDADDTVLSNKCDRITRQMKPWKEKQTTSFYPGLIAQVEPPDPGEPLSRKWPIAKFRLENGTLRYRENRQDAGTIPSLEQFLKRIAHWKNSGQHSVQPTNG